MSFTAIPGDPAAQPGSLQLGAAPTVQIKWQGPFSPGEMFIAGVGIVVVLPGVLYSVSSAVAQQLYLSDPNWYVLS